MDYAFAPGTTAQDGRARRLFRRRPQTTLIARARNRSTVRQFINHVSNAGGIARPIDDLLIGTHANDQGFLFIPMYSGQAGATDFETLEQTLANAARSIEIPDALIGFNEGDPINHSFHIKGCNIGKARPFIVKLKEALGDKVHVSAPKHFHYIYWHSNYGVWEAMEYEFRVLRDSAFPNRADAIAAFQNQNFARIDGSVVPAGQWANWIPRRVNRSSSTTVNVNLGVNIGARSTIPIDRDYRYQPPSNRTNFVFTINYPNPAAVPGDRATRENDLQTAINNHPLFANAHDFPQYERWGYGSRAEFIAGYNWRFAQNGNQLVCTGRRHVYTMIVPITDIATGNLIFNFYPNAGSPHAAITNGLIETDGRFFERV